MPDKNTKGHEGRPDLTGEHRWGDAGQVVLIFLFLGVWMTDSFLFHYSNPLIDSINIYIRLVVAALVMIRGAILARSSLNIVFGEVRETPSVIRKGPFAKMRHPVYVAAMLMYLALLLVDTTIASLCVFAVIVLFYYFLSRYEEKLLIERFGQDYVDYMKKVPMWISFK